MSRAIDNTMSSGKGVCNVGNVTAPAAVAVLGDPVLGAFPGIRLLGYNNLLKYKETARKTLFSEWNFMKSGG